VPSFRGYKLAIFGGLFIGNDPAAIRADRMRRPLLWYGVLELAVGLSALLSTFGFRYSEGMLTWLVSGHLSPLLHLDRFTTAMTVALAPTTECVEICKEVPAMAEYFAPESMINRPKTSNTRYSYGRRS